MSFVSLVQVIDITNGFNPNARKQMTDGFILATNTVITASLPEDKLKILNIQSRTVDIINKWYDKDFGHNSATDHMVSVLITVALNQISEIAINEG